MWHKNELAANLKGVGAMRTSGKVPFENTINRQVWKGGQRRGSKHGNDENDLSASTISNDDKFPANFSHVDWEVSELSE